MPEQIRVNCDYETLVAKIYRGLANIANYEVKRVDEAPGYTKLKVNYRLPEFGELGFVEVEKNNDICIVTFSDLSVIDDYDEWFKQALEKIDQTIGEGEDRMLLLGKMHAQKMKVDPEFHKAKQRTWQETIDIYHRLVETFTSGNNKQLSAQELKVVNEEIRVSDQLTLYLEESNESQFCKWLLAYSKKMCSANGECPYPGSGVYSIVYPLAVPQVGQIGFSARIKQPPRSNEGPPPGVDQWEIIDPETGKNYLYWEWAKENLITLSWVEVGKRLKLSIAYENGLWILPPVFQLLWAIKADFPETAESVLNHVKQQADWWNLYPPLPNHDGAIAYIIAMRAREQFDRKINQSTEHHVAQDGTANVEKDEPSKVEILKNECQQIIENKLKGERDRLIAHTYRRGGNWRDVSELLGGNRSYQTAYRHIQRVRELCGKDSNGEWVVPKHKNNQKAKKKRKKIDIY